MSSMLSSNNGLYMVPALTGLGAPHWAPSARGAIYGITRDTGKADFARAALEPWLTRQMTCSQPSPVKASQYLRCVLTVE